MAPFYQEVKLKYLNMELEVLRLRPTFWDLIHALLEFYAPGSQVIKKCTSMFPIFPSSDKNVLFLIIIHSVSHSFIQSFIHPLVAEILIESMLSLYKTLY